MFSTVAVGTPSSGTKLADQMNANSGAESGAARLLICAVQLG